MSWVREGWWKNELVQVVVNKFTPKQYCISWIILNLLTTLFTTMVLTVYETMKILTSKSISGKIKIDETMKNRYY